MNTEDRVARALDLRRQGYNCAQCVAMAFDDVLALEHTTIARIMHGFGTGFGGSREMCGAVSGATMVLGTISDARPEVYSAVSGLVADFKAINGSCICRELKDEHHRQCPDLIATAVTLLASRLTEA